MLPKDRKRLYPPGDQEGAGPFTTSVLLHTPHCTASTTPFLPQGTLCPTSPTSPALQAPSLGPCQSFPRHRAQWTRTWRATGIHLWVGPHPPLQEGPLLPCSREVSPRTQTQAFSWFQCCLRGGGGALTGVERETRGNRKWGRNNLEKLQLFRPWHLLTLTDVDSHQLCRLHTFIKRGGSFAFSLGSSEIE